MALPVPVLKPNFGINQPAATEQQPIIRKIAGEEKVQIIDLFKAINKQELFDRDGIHPNGAGAKKMAEVIHAVLTAKAK